MSSIAPTTRLGWRLLPAVTAAAAAVITASLLIGALRAHPVVVSRGGTRAPVAADIVDAAVWHTDAYPVGASGKLDKSQRAHFDAQKVRLRATVRDLADAISLDPGRLPRAARRVMTAVAGRSLVAKAPGLPKGAEGITALERSGRIGIQVPGFSAATAEIRMVMQATIDDRLVKWRDDITFWLSRSDDGWAVIAFDVERAQR